MFDLPARLLEDLARVRAEQRVAVQDSALIHEALNCSSANTPVSKSISTSITEERLIVVATAMTRRNVSANSWPWPSRYTSGSWLMSNWEPSKVLLSLLIDHSVVRRNGREKGPLWRMETSTDRDITKANLSRASKNINIACDDARLSSVEKIRRIKEEIEKVQNCLERLSLGSGDFDLIGCD